MGEKSSQGEPSNSTPTSISDKGKSKVGELVSTPPLELPSVLELLASPKDIAPLSDIPCPETITKNESNLVEVTIQSSSLGRRIVHRKKSSVTKQGDPEKKVSSEIMKIDKSVGFQGEETKGFHKRSSEVLLNESHSGL
ncbi:BPI fold-containing family B member 1 [Striga asiatica]|uniref:BPI fold-containing family B member 1 n=1 Tax=Striga asiatica TaxID=4170 RepID=A0A5A7QUM6_STRAF|nr:BPI fold-containing family B member 1 [Striga asiatica]